jgi:hypothetical protein
MHLYNPLHFVSEESDSIALFVLVGGDYIECIPDDPESSRGDIDIISGVVTFN